jgi:hypothetical protein
MRRHVTGDQARHIDHAHSLKEPCPVGRERHRPGRRSFSQVVTCRVILHHKISPASCCLIAGNAALSDGLLTMTKKAKQRSKNLKALVDPLRNGLVLSLA